jgi:hypothetical protein
MANRPSDPHPLLVKCEVRPSQIFGQGLYPAQAVNKGTVVCFFALNGQLLTEDEYVAGIEARDYDITRSGTRLVGRYFTFSKIAADLNYINHSFEPNLLCHCGVVVALRDIAIGEEFTLDYRYLVDSTEVGLYDDIKTGRQIRGFTARQTLLATARQLMEIVERIENWEG